MGDIVLIPGNWFLFDNLKGTFLKVPSYITRYPVLGSIQSASHFTPWKSARSNAISTSLGSIQPCCNYCAKTIFSDIHLCL